MKRALLAALLLAAPAEVRAGARAEQALRLYCGGGFTGGGGGVAVDSAGQLTRLRRQTFAAPLESRPIEGRPQPVAEWLRMLEGAGFRRLPRGEPSNMTCTLTMGAGPTGHFIMWRGTGTPPDLPAPVLHVIAALRRLQQDNPFGQ
ncbi:hypothetical protein EOD42_00190 [Rhodovarius crocodyli]|uniref:Uncharacterized protein n=1 Tax=Rhodovarius crocodyli TaxID=1979269 RepID=A0A437MLS2_9PROT|nr:hypothetical protein [Rhodovarius crocodyli]RVT98575.1 hypothetical protein EOD42_00190 [Rhodovarius crocodyli]